MEFTAEQLQEKWDELTGFVETYIASPRKEALLALYTKYQERILLAPASAKEHYHNAFPGGFIDHTLRVVRNARAEFALWKATGANVSNFTEEELVFSALNHDLGKIGDEDGEFYTPNKSDWHRINQGKIYTFNPDVVYMNGTDRGLYLLQSNGVVLSRNEYIAIYLADGLFEEKNKAYLVGYERDQQLRCNLPHIIHHADFLALQIERDAWREEQQSFEGNIAKINPQTSPKKAKSNPQVRNEQTKAVFEASPEASARFEKLFGESSDVKYLGGE